MKFDFCKSEYDYFVEQCGFTDAELKVLELKRRGWFNADISAELYISESTVKRRCCSIHNKILKVMLYK